MSKPIEDNDNAKEFWEHLSDASALDPATKAAIIALIGATTLGRIYNTTTESYYVLTLAGTAGNEILTWTPEA